MTARHKLNAAHLHGVLVVAGIVAAAAGSWLLFGFLLVVLISSAIHAGDIRLSTRKRT